MAIATHMILYVDGREIMSTDAGMIKAKNFHYTLENVDFDFSIAAAVVGALPTLVVGGVTIFSPYANINFDWSGFK
jgi:hypothetical protein